MEGKNVVNRATIKPQKFVVTEEVSDQPLPSLPITCEPTISSPPEVHRMKPLAMGSSSAAPLKASGLFYKLQGRAPLFTPRQVQQPCGTSACAKGRNDLNMLHDQKTKAVAPS